MRTEYNPSLFDGEKWLQLATLAEQIAFEGRKGAKAWHELEQLRKRTAKAQVFGHNDHGNVCNCLIEVCRKAIEGDRSDAVISELARLSAEVIQRHKAWALVRAARSERAVR